MQLTSCKHNNTCSYNNDSSCYYNYTSGNYDDTSGDYDNTGGNNDDTWYSLIDVLLRVFVTLAGFDLHQFSLFD